MKHPNIKMSKLFKMAFRLFKHALYSLNIEHHHNKTNRRTNLHFSCYHICQQLVMTDCIESLTVFACMCVLVLRNIIIRWSFPAVSSTGVYVKIVAKSYDQQMAHLLKTTNSPLFSLGWQRNRATRARANAISRGKLTNYRARSRICLFLLSKEK